MGCNGWNVCIARVTKLNTDTRGQKAHVCWLLVAAKMKQKKTKSFSAHLPFIVYKNFPHTNELLEYDQHLKYKLLENSFGS